MTLDEAVAQLRADIAEAGLPAAHLGECATDGVIHIWTGAEGCTEMPIFGRETNAMVGKCACLIFNDAETWRKYSFRVGEKTLDEAIQDFKKHLEAECLMS